MTARPLAEDVSEPPLKVKKIENISGGPSEKASEDILKLLYPQQEDPIAVECVTENLSSVGEAQVAQFVEKGYLLVRNCLSKEQICEALEGIRRLSSEENDAFNSAAARTAKENPDMSDGGGQPIFQFQVEGLKLAKGERAHCVRKLQNYHRYEPALNWDEQRKDIKACIRKLMGLAPEADLSIFQSLALLKPAGIGVEKPWHQDHAYFNVPLVPTPSGSPSTVTGVWVALDEAFAGNGCMFVIPGSHKAGATAHFHRRDWQLCDASILEHTNIQAVPMKPGDALIFSSLLYHGTPPNTSSKSRRAIQCHFVADKTLCSVAERLAAFGEQGKGVSC